MEWGPDRLEGGGWSEMFFVALFFPQQYHPGDFFKLYL